MHVTLKLMHGFIFVVEGDPVNETTLALCIHMYVYKFVYNQLYVRIQWPMQALPNSPYMLEEVVKSVSEESSSLVKLQLLSAVMKMFFKRPPECQEILGRLLEHSIGE